MTFPSQTLVEEPDRQRDEFIERLFRSAAGVFDVFTIYIGHRLGFYTALAGCDSLSSTELASRTATHERYVREWLEQQTVAGILRVQNPDSGANARRFGLPVGLKEVLVERESLNYMAPLSQLLVGAVHPLESVLNAYRNGGGVAYEEYGRDLREGQAEMNRAMLLKQLGTEWLAAIPDVHARFQANRNSRVADIGCGAGWSSIGVAQAYPKVRVDGYDLDGPSIELARKNSSEAGLSHRVSFYTRDASDPALRGRYDLVIAFECLHDMSDPVGVLRTMRNLADENGAVIIVDERVGETFSEKGTEVEWMMYGWSVLHCLPVGMATQPSTGTGTVMRPDILRSYAAQAGFRAVEILPIDNFFFRFYRLRH